MQSVKKITLCFVGGGTLGSVTPLLALHQSAQEMNAFWIGTTDGPERQFVEARGIPFMGVPGFRLRRFFSFKTFIELPQFFKAYRKAKTILQQRKPDILLAAGSFIQVPVAFAARRLKIPIVLLQLDAQKGLANTIVSRFAKVVCGPFVDQQHWGSIQTVPCSVPVFPELRKNGRATQGTSLLIIGGGTGSEWLNAFVEAKIDELLSFAHVVHCQGMASRSKKIQPRSAQNSYTSYGIVDQETMVKLYSQSCLVICRAGMGTLSEIVALAKPAIVVPMPHTHQEKNAAYYSDRKAIVTFQQDQGFAELAIEVKKLFKSKERQQELMDSLRHVSSEQSEDTLLQLISNYARTV